MNARSTDQRTSGAAVLSLILGILGMFGDFLPGHPEKFREGQKSLPDEEFLNVLVDEDSPTTVAVYLCRSGT